MQVPFINGGNMPITQSDLNAFHQYAGQKLAARGVESLHELVDLWDIEHPIAKLSADNGAAIQAAIRDMAEGDRGDRRSNCR
jgi:hypothetical protein